MQTWEEWKRVHHLKIQHIAGFEEKFVDTVLSNISLISPEDVIPQYHFIDHKNGNRYIDFVIVISRGSSKTLLPIELDGKTKFDTYESFNDTLERQNDLISQFGFLLRYSNKKMLEQPQAIISEITQFIQNTLDQKDTAEIKRRNFEQYKQSVEFRLSNLTKQLEKLDQIDQLFSGQQQILEKSILSKVEGQLEQLHKQLNELHQKQSINSSVGVKSLLFICGICIFILIGILGLQIIKSEPVNTKNSEIQVEPLIGEPKEINTKQENNSSIISPQQAKQYVGLEKVICGNVVEITPFSKGVYLNLEEPYPNQALSIVIWDSDIPKFDGAYLKLTLQQRYCVIGKIERYKDQLQIVLSNPTKFYLESKSR